MATNAFDASGAVRFDLKTGAASDARGARLVLVPSVALEKLGSDALTMLGQAIGGTAGERVASRLGGETGVRSAAVETVLSHLAGELAVSGVFAMHIERWGKALVAVVANASIASEMFVGAVLGAALSAATGREVAAASLGGTGGEVRYFLGSQGTADHVRVLIGRGMSQTDVLATIQGLQGASA
ncbi:MAG: hypothetical protein JWP97_302 [Labilithrix sp.]|nr:hypothetical protein [Labilithrix sp.]